jgi:hypothetical protein
MSEESTTPDLVHLTRAAWTEVNRQDWDAVGSYFAPDAAFDVSPAGMGRAAAEGLAEERG